MLVKYFLNLNTNLQALLILLSINSICYLLLKKQKINLSIFCFFVFVIISFFLFQSRGLIIAAALSGIYLFYNRFTKHTLKYILLGGIACVLLLSILIVKKSNATKGRYFILKTQIQFLKQTKSNYSVKNVNHFQIDRFKQNKDTAYAQFANTNNYVLNDVLQLSLQYGIKGFIIILFLIVGFMFYIKKSIASKQVNLWLLLLVPFQIFICINSPLQVASLAWLYIFLYGMFLLSQVDYLLWYYKFALGLLFSLYCSYAIKNEVVGFSKINKSKELFNSGYINEAYHIYNSLSKQNKKKYITFYATYLHHVNKIDSAIQILEINHEHLCNYDYHISLGNYYKEQLNYTNALNNFVDAQYLVPHKIAPLYYQMLIYKEQSIFNKVHFFANAIIQKQPKIINAQSNFFKSEAKKLLIFSK